MLLCSYATLRWITRNVLPVYNHPIQVTGQDSCKVITMVTPTTSYILQECTAMTQTEISVHNYTINRHIHTPWSIIHNGCNPARITLSMCRQSGVGTVLNTLVISEKFCYADITVVNNTMGILGLVSEPPNITGIWDIPLYAWLRYLGYSPSCLTAYNPSLAGSIISCSSYTTDPGLQ